jgi:hypothetical protein
LVVGGENVHWQAQCDSFGLSATFHRYVITWLHPVYETKSVLKGLWLAVLKKSL